MSVPGSRRAQLGAVVSAVPPKAAATLVAGAAVRPRTASRTATVSCSIDGSCQRDVPKSRLLQWAAMVLSAGIPASSFRY